MPLRLIIISLLTFNLDLITNIEKFKLFTKVYSNRNLMQLHRNIWEVVIGNCLEKGRHNNWQLIE